MDKLLIRGGTIVSPDQSEVKTGDVWVKDGLIAKSGNAPTTIINAQGLYVAPGFIDLQVTELNAGGITMELLADGVHIHEAAISLLLKIKGIDVILLVTDATSAAGLIDGRYFLGSTPITVRNGIAQTDSGTLAGSTLTMERALANLCRFAQLDLTTAVKTVSLNPARLLGINDKTGSLEIGKSADVVLFDGSFQVYYTIVQGKIMYKKEDT